MKDLLFVKALHLSVFATQKLDSKVMKNENLSINKSGNNKLFLLKKMMALKYKEGTSTADHETFQVSLINSAPQGIITLDLAKSSVLNEEVRRSQGSTSQSEVLVTENMGEIEIKMLKKENKGGGDKHDRKDDEKSERVATATHDDFLVICDENLVNLVCDETSWVIDTGASLHVTSRRDFFTSYTPSDFGVLKMGNDNLVLVIGMRDVSLVSNNGTNLTLKDVRHAPDICLNLISAGKLDDEGFCNTFSERQWKLTKGSLDVARGKKSSNLYLMSASTYGDTVNVTVNDSSTELWHKRLSHMSEKGLNCLAKRNQLSGLKNATQKNCVHCLAGKQRRVSFRSPPPHRRSELLELVLLDIFGPIKVRSHGGALYFETFIDDCSRKLWVYTLMSKDQVFEVFKQFQASVERETRKKLKCIRTDNGDEYTRPFHEYYLRQGIRHQRTPPKTSHLNGLAKRMNRTLIERVRYRVWFGKDVSYDHLRVFGCKTFVHVLKDERSKLDAKTRQCIFIGYGLDGEFGYRLYDPLQKKLVRSRDVIFVEDRTIDDIDKTKKANSQDSDELIDVNPVPLDPSPDPIQGEVHGDVNDDQQDIGDLDAPMDDVVNDQQQAHIAPPAAPLRRSSRNRRYSIRYSSNEYALLTDEGEPECYEEAMESECKDQSKHVDVRYHWIRDVLEAKLLELEKIRTDDNGADMLTKDLPRVKFEACCLTSDMEAFPT
ncbi:hypothetical protein HRI_004716700 [Hibiscus trionum]|nr:hypothetical protein HRI_004716700 [Hibiscus trionum]